MSEPRPSPEVARALLAEMYSGERAPQDARPAPPRRMFVVGKLVGGQLTVLPAGACRICSLGMEATASL